MPTDYVFSDRCLNSSTIQEFANQVYATKVKSNFKETTLAGMVDSFSNLIKYDVVEVKDSFDGAGARGWYVGRSVQNKDMIIVQFRGDSFASEILRESVFKVNLTPKELAKDLAKEIGLNKYQRKAVKALIESLVG